MCNTEIKANPSLLSFLEAAEAFQPLLFFSWIPSNAARSHTFTCTPLLQVDVLLKDHLQGTQPSGQSSSSERVAGTGSRDADSLRNLGQLPSAGHTVHQLKTQLHQETDALAEFHSPGRIVKGLPARQPQPEGQPESHVPWDHPDRQLETYQTSSHPPLSEIT